MHGKGEVVCPADEPLANQSSKKVRCHVEFLIRVQKEEREAGNHVVNHAPDESLDLQNRGQTLAFLVHECIYTRG